MFLQFIAGKGFQGLDNIRDQLFLPFCFLFCWGWRRLWGLKPGPLRVKQGLSYCAAHKHKHAHTHCHFCCYKVIQCILGTPEGIFQAGLGLLCREGCFGRGRVDGRHVNNISNASCLRHLPYSLCIRDSGTGFFGNVAPATGVFLLTFFYSLVLLDGSQAQSLQSKILRNLLDSMP